MAEDGSGQDLMGYEAMAQEALRGVVRSALKRAAGPGGLPGDHHFYISFRTQAAGVSIPPELVDRYPDEMTIVLQHKFWELAPGETFFSITLQFGGQPKRLSMPYTAVTRFYDPSVQFLLQFEAASAQVTSEHDEERQGATEPTRLRPRREAGDGAGETDGSKASKPQTLKPEAVKSEAAKSKTGPKPQPAAKSDSPGEDAPKIVSLDQFRKK